MRFKGAVAGKRKLWSTISPQLLRAFTERLQYYLAWSLAFERHQTCCAPNNNDVKAVKSMKKHFIEFLITKQVSELQTMYRLGHLTSSIKGTLRNRKRSKIFGWPRETIGKKMGGVGRTRNTLHYVPHFGKLLIKDLYFYERLYSLSTNVDYRLKWR